MTWVDFFFIENIQPSYMFLAYKHTNMCAQLMRKRTEMMGIEDSVISMDDYFTGLVRITFYY
jgi:hypothetical protein